MTELDILNHAKGYLDKLSAGIDPLTGESQTAEPKPESQPASDDGDK